jgi:hypothetical protein
VRSLLLDRTQWDLTVDNHGNLAIADDPYATAQDVACACRLFLGECYYDTTRGIPYFQEVLGRNPPLSVLKGTLIDAAKTVPGVQSAVVYISTVSGREVTGQVQVTLTNGTTLTVDGALGSLAPV